MGLGLFFAATPVLAQVAPPPGAKAIQAEKKKLAVLQAAYDKTKNPKRGPQIKDHVTATLSLADAVMVSPALPPKEKYPRALRLYREALSYDAKNRKAREGRDLIEGIYKSMGRPIPK